VFHDADSLLFTVFTLVLIALSLLFTILLIRSKPSTANKWLPKEIKKTKITTKIKTKQKTKAKKEIDAPEIRERPENQEAPENRRRSKVAPIVRGCLHYLGYLEGISTSSFPYECLACSKLGECMGERKKKLEKAGTNMSKHTVAKRIESTIEKSNKAPWRAWRGKNEQAVPRNQVPELYDLLKELGGKIKHNDWEYQCYEKPLNIVVKTKS
jgi:hypothetical protein